LRRREDGGGDETRRGYEERYLLYREDQVIAGS
jgi:hypothetical protein